MGLDIKVASLFSGCGGLDLGFERAGFKIIFANDIDKDACFTYSKNLKSKILCEDIYKLDSKQVPDCDVLIGGFPCLGFTIANGKNRDLGSKYNALYIEYARILEAKKPQCFLVENVMGIKSGGEFRENFENKILKSFEAAGYRVKYSVLNANDFLVAQNRKRVIIIGVRSDLKGEIDFPTPHNYKPTLKECIGDLPEEFSESIANHMGNAHAVKINGYVGNRVLKWDKPSPTITGRGSRGGGAVIHPHPNLKRRLSVRECARLQSFPDDFIFYGSNSACYAHIGNAVAPLFAFFIANKFRKFFNLAEIPLPKWELPYLK
ncbi:MAG: DNA cytosine methyltransferase [Helicobacter sp.]|nr:DNA cytosine methyltransferase [Helicobacteraceae bacterium]MDY3112797.1 DNA cytosine methyltransferase [Helicobacter sp.]